VVRGGAARGGEGEETGSIVAHVQQPRLHFFAEVDGDFAFRAVDVGEEVGERFALDGGIDGGQTPRVGVAPIQPAQEGADTR